MRELPIIKRRRLEQLLIRLRYEKISQRGSHINYRLEDKTVIVPQHDEIRRGTLISNLKNMQMQRDEFIELIS
jgi:predicted RNA binding protein YcfA (HicA-like mRNA interferase family)